VRGHCTATSQVTLIAVCAGETAGAACFRPGIAVKSIPSGRRSMPAGRRASPPEGVSTGLRLFLRVYRNQGERRLRITRKTKVSSQCRVVSDQLTINCSDREPRAENRGLRHRNRQRKREDVPVPFSALAGHSRQGSRPPPSGSSVMTDTDGPGVSLSWGNRLISVSDQARRYRPTGAPRPVHHEPDRLIFRPRGL
jgi:hypothetical protein